MQELKNFINEIYSKTKLAVTIYDKKGCFLFGEEDGKTIKEIKGIVFEGNKIFFELSFLGEKYIAKLSAEKDATERYVYFIQELASKYTSENAPKNKEDFFKKLLDGKINYLNVIKYADKFKVKDRKCVVLIIAQEKGDNKDVISVASNYVESTTDCVFSYDKNRTILIKFSIENNKEYRSIKEYAEFLAQTIYEETGSHVHIAIGGVSKKLIDIEKSYMQALSVFAMRKTLGKAGNVHSFREFVVIKALDELPETKKEEYLRLLVNDCNVAVFDDPILLETAEEFFESNLNISLASRKTYLHRNTLTYRLDKIQRETGLDLRKYNDAVTFKLISVLNKLLKK